MAVTIVQAVAAGGIAGGLAGLGLAGVAWRNREVPGAVPFGLLSLAISGWAAFGTAQLLAGSPDAAYLFDRLSRVFNAHVAPLALVFVVAFAGHDEWLQPRYLAALWTLPVGYVLLSLTAPWHGLASAPADVSMVTVDGVTAPVVPVGPVEQVHLVVAYATLTVSYVLLFRFMLGTRSSHRNQATVIAVGMFVPIVANAAFHVGLGVHPGVDLTPATFVVSGVVTAWGLFRYELLTVAPLASDVLVDELPDPVLVLDDGNRIIDSNPAASRAFDGRPTTGTDVSDVAPGLLDALGGSETYTPTDGRSADGGTQRFYDPQVSTVDDRYGGRHGRLVVLRDVTGQQRQQDRLEALQAATRQFITASTDDEIARLALEFVHRVLEQHSAVVFLFDEDDGVLRPAAATDCVTDHFGEDELVVAEGDSPVWRTYAEQSVTVADVEDGERLDPYARLLLLPIDDRGVIAIGSSEAEPFPNEDRQFASILAQTTQVALSQVEYERQLIRSHTSVERRSEQIEFFNGVLRHTLRNALLVIQGRAQYLGDHVDPDERRHLEVVDRWCDDLAALNDEIRAINDTVTATESKRLGAVDLTAVVDERVRAVEQQYDDVTVDVDVAERVEVLANELAGRVLEDVITNAVQHNDADDPQVRVWTQRAADRVQVHVADNGPGLSEELKETVFERDLSATQTANGFGLYFVSVIMNLYGGTVWFEDNDPRGTVAVLEFQAAD